MNDCQIRRVCIIGTGTQGAQIAFRTAINNKTVYVYDVSPKAVEDAKKKIQGWLMEYVEDSRISVDESKLVFEKLIFKNDLSECLSNVDLVIEVVPERLELKRRVWEQIDSIAPENVMLTTNSSSLKSSDIGVNVKRKNKTFNLNFMTPVKDDLVEVMWNKNTSEETKTAALNYLYDLKLVPIVTNKEIKGFSHNRVWRAIKKETLKLWDQGYCAYEDLDRAFMLEFGTSFGPFGLMDVVGLDVVRDIELSYYDESKNETDKPPKSLIEMVEKGYLGVKSGKGFYEYPNPKYTDSNWLHKRR